MQGTRQINRPACAECSSRLISLNQLWADHQSIYHWAQYIHWTLTKRNSELEQQRQAYSELHTQHEQTKLHLRGSEIEVGKLTAQLRKVEPVLQAIKKSKRCTRMASSEQVI